MSNFFGSTKCGWNIVAKFIKYNFLGSTSCNRNMWIIFLEVLDVIGMLWIIFWKYFV